MVLVFMMTSPVRELILLFFIGAIQLASACTDQSEHCAAWKAAGYCAPSSPYNAFMKTSCQKSCSLCSPTASGPDCKDKSSYCSSYKAYCKDPGYIDYLKVECKKTCDYCWVTTRPPPTTLYVSTQPYTGPGGRELQPGCGLRPKDKQRIVGGKNALPNSWPWQVSMDWINNEANPGHLCGATLITDEWVVTAAHCFVNDKDKDNYWLTLGQHNIKKKSGREQVFNISELLIHPKYNKANQDYDLALMKLKGKATLNEWVSTACLPGRDTEYDSGKVCYITGWGLLSEYGEGPAILQQAKVPLITKDTCKNAYAPLNYEITPRMLCAGYEKGGIDSCEGDSGGPLVCSEKGDDGKDNWYLWGAISWGVGCARKGMYGVLSSLKVLRPWLDEVVFKI